ncbi:MAG: hypothetical protein HOY78_20530, partial [Saccharothrix sp.]|nr:hypothetical protein [Saccharothrix sp.]
MVRSRGTAAALVALLSLTGCAQQSAPAGPAPTTTTEPLRVSLCDDPGDLVAWLRAEDLAVDEARCSADPTDTRPLRAYGKWTFPPAGRGTPHVESVE